MGFSIKKAIAVYLLVLQLSEEFLLVHDRVDTPLGDDATLTHLFHCVQLFLFLLLHFPHLTESASADHIMKLKVVLGNGYRGG